MESIKNGLTFTVAVVSTVINSFVNNAGAELGMYTPQIGPFDAQQEDMHSQIGYIYNSDYSNMGEIVSFAYHGGEIEKSNVFEKHTYSRFAFHNRDYVLPLKTYLKSSGLDIIFRTYNYTTNTNIEKRIVTIYPRSHSNINPFNLINMTYTSKDIAAQINAGAISYTNCQYNFNNLQPYFNMDWTSFLDLSDSSFTYSSPIDFSYNSGKLKFVDEKEIFPYLPIDSEGFKYVDLKLEINNGIVSFGYAHDFYYDPKTLQISVIWRNGFSETNRFLVPKNKSNDLSKYTFFIELDGVGGDMINISYPIKFTTYHNYFGTCDKSDYCIMGGIKK